MGLEQLLTITDKDFRYHEQALKMYKDSTIQENWYFFSCTGLNITQKILNTMIDTTKIDDAILEHWELLIGDDVPEWTLV